MKYLFLFLFAWLPIFALAQHEHHQPQPQTKPQPKPKPIPKPQPKPSKPVQQKNIQKEQPVIIPDTVQNDHRAHDIGNDMSHATDTIQPNHEAHDMGEDMSHVTDTMQNGHEAHQNMSHAFSISLSMNRNGSGTGWLPDASPMYGIMKHSKNWMFMFHGNVFLRYNSQDITNKGSRGDSKADVPNWLMAMGQRRVGRNGLFHFSGMFSADAVIAGGSGYPLLFQSGETWEGEPLVDRQHPHDLFSELSVSYAHALSRKADLFVYLGYPGEPAIGPVAFMHRPSALTNPDAPLSHHWTDATHITFGVATLGLRYGKFKLEGSSFTGREPDENRYDFDKPRFDSWSGRLSFNPSHKWTLQASHGFIKSPEALHAGEDINRTTASVIYSQPLGTKPYLNASAVWGMNKAAGHDAEHAVLLEANVSLNKWAVYSRYEWVQKSAEELDIDNLFSHHAIFNVNAFTLGTAYDILDFWHLRLAAGVQGSLYHTDDRLNGLYGKNPLAGEIYLRLYPGLMMGK